MTSSKMSTAFYFGNGYLMAFDYRVIVAFQSNSPSRYSAGSVDAVICQGRYTQSLE